MPKDSVEYERRLVAAPQAHSVDPRVCRSPTCRCIHLVLEDKDELPIAQAVLPLEWWARMAYRAPALIDGPADLAVERNAALAIAGAWLDGQMNALVQMVPGDPDCDACVVARQLVRSLQRVSEVDRVVDAARELADDLRATLTRAGPDADPPILELKLIDAVDALAMRLKPPGR